MHLSQIWAWIPDIIKSTSERVGASDLDNVELRAMPAHEIDKIENLQFDVIIINSVIQSFDGLNYLRLVLKKCISLLGDKGLVFLGDLQDIDQRTAFINSLNDFQDENC